ncbi:hypothetical protein CYMTET_15565 [Cymbomonas tetramitiformis]|uniref:Uncharacterized protein n=1 Tax=Cymbomonas tetramitiformis TaxID=36881 RepID=A0AAE0GE45_9CHLO|nr:hypothetical protein CYMTET_15565 [Cymbomonas tetramitiformis]
MKLPIWPSSFPALVLLISFPEIHGQYASPFKLEQGLKEAGSPQHASYTADARVHDGLFEDSEEDGKADHMSEASPARRAVLAASATVATIARR